MQDQFERQILDIIGLMTAVLGQHNPVDPNTMDYIDFCLRQLVSNVVEHNSEDSQCHCFGYFMAQRTPYGRLEFVISDVGKGYRRRLLDMINDGKDVNIKSISHLHERLADRSMLLRNSDKNPNLIAIDTAVKYRKNQNKPGLWQIKEFAAGLKGSLFVHSGNFGVKYSSNDEETSLFYKDSYFSGCHLRVEIPLPTKK